MRSIIAVSILVLVVGSGCCSLFCPVGIEGERLAEVNQSWWDFYNTHRRMTPEEAETYAELTDEEKLEWRREGKPTDRPLLGLKLEAVHDFKKAVDMEAEAAE